MLRRFAPFTLAAIFTAFSVIREGERGHEASCQVDKTSLAASGAPLKRKTNTKIGASTATSTLALSSSQHRLEAFLKDLRALLPSDLIDTNEEECIQRGKPWNSYHPATNFPGVIVMPASTEHVSIVVRLCKKHNIPLIPYGGGTSLEGQLLTPMGGVSLDFCNMKSIVELREGDLDVTVQAGIGYIELNELLKPKGLWFPLDPGPGASVGGMCATRCSGSTAVKYGSMRENVLNVTAVLADDKGTIIKTGSRARKSSAGYDITRLLIGSEGTLAVITEATLKVYPLPSHSYAVRVAFPSVAAAALCASDTLRKGITVGRCELIDEIMINDINAANPQLPGGAWPEQVTLLYEITGPSSRSVNEQIDTLQELAKEHEATSVVVATDPQEVALVWKTRKECLWSTMSQHPGLEPMITDVCVPLSRLAELISETRVELDASSLHCPVIAHAGDGNFHVLIMFDPLDVVQKAEAHHLADQMAYRAIRLGGTCTGEHGVGVGKRHLLMSELGAGTLGVMHAIKRTMDADGILNPGKVLLPEVTETDA